MSRCNPFAKYNLFILVTTFTKKKLFTDFNRQSLNHKSSMTLVQLSFWRMHFKRCFSSVILGLDILTRSDLVRTSSLIVSNEKFAKMPFSIGEIFYHNEKEKKSLQSANDQRF